MELLNTTQTFPSGTVNTVRISESKGKVSIDLFARDANNDLVGGHWIELSDAEALELWNNLSKVVKV